MLIPRRATSETEQARLSERAHQDREIVYFLQPPETHAFITYPAPVSYRLEGDELVFDRSLGRPRNAVVFPSGWYCTFSAAPATVTRLPDGRVRLDDWDDRPEAVDVLLKGRRRVGGS